jgi:hypothetical protein
MTHIHEVVNMKARKIMMFYWQNCPNAVLMQPALYGLKMSGRYEIEMHETGSTAGAKALSQYRDLIKKETGKENASPVFVDIGEKKAAQIQDFESVMAWLEGPEWWKNL